jgi:hypothetical protein
MCMQACMLSFVTMPNSAIKDFLFHLESKELDSESPRLLAISLREPFLDVSCQDISITKEF